MKEEVTDRKYQGDSKRADTGSFIQPTMQAFHVRNLTVINNTYSSIQSSTVDYWGLKFRVESHSNHHHHREGSDILTSSQRLMGTFIIMRNAMRERVLFPVHSFKVALGWRLQQIYKVLSQM